MKAAQLAVATALGMGALGLGMWLQGGAARADDQPHSVILFVSDGLRARIVNNQTAPVMASVRDNGVRFANSHSLFPTFTTANASAMATGHYLGDTGDFSNVIYSGFPVPGAGNSLTPFLESDPVLGDVDAHFAGNYLDQLTILQMAREAGFQTAAIGKLGPTLIFDHTERSGQKTVIIDDSTGSKNGIPLASWVSEGLIAANLATAAPTRGENGNPGSAKTAGTLEANTGQQNWMVDATTKVVLPEFKKQGKPFLLVFWSRDPDGTQHNQGDSLNSITPGINGPTTMASIKNSDDDLGRLRQALADLGLDKTTDVIVTADHGFSTISKQSATSLAAKASYSDVPAGFVPPGFVAIDIATMAGLPLWDPDNGLARVAEGAYSKRANGLIGNDPNRPSIVVAANGGSDLVYFPKPVDRELVRKVVEGLMKQDYVSGLFVDDALGSYPGTMTTKDINLKGSAVTPPPAIAINFASKWSGCDEPTNCTVELADTGLQQGQGMHGSFSRADTLNFMAAIGPDFKTGYVDEAPASNVDLGKTILAILKLKPGSHGKLVGRVLGEAFPGGMTPDFTSHTRASKPDANGLRTILRYQTVGDTKYFDAAGFLGRTVGLE
ncbi:Type I phosphodiesterase / nucleotide pyrophosphatase [Rhizobiales bacterium GAS113]|nr:Type I phosphodiesterase / nucleotide pyrophosphatase [Rhizobiales bacterium GAS113]